MVSLYDTLRVGMCYVGEGNLITIMLIIVSKVCNLGGFRGHCFFVVGVKCMVLVTKLYNSQ